MWKHKNFINLQLCAPTAAWLLKINFDSNITKIETTDSDGRACIWTVSGQTTTVQAKVGNNYTFTCTLTNGYVLDTTSVGNIVNDNQFAITFDGNTAEVTITTRASTPALTFKHFYDAGLQGTGSIKFRHYSQQEPSSGETWVLNETVDDSADFSYDVDFVSNEVEYQQISCNIMFGIIGYLPKGATNKTVAYKGGWQNQAYRTITFASAPTGDLLTWLQANGTKQGGGDNVIKAGTYKWVDTPDIQGITDIIGDDGGLDGQFKSSDITFDGFGYSAHWNRIMYDPRENFASLIENQEVDKCGYLDGQWGVKPKYSSITVVPALQTFTILEDIDLSSAWNDTEIEQAILSWFTANTTKLS